MRAALNRMRDPETQTWCPERQCEPWPGRWAPGFQAACCFLEHESSLSGRRLSTVTQSLDSGPLGAGPVISPSVLYPSQPKGLRQGTGLSTKPELRSP